MVQARKQAVCVLLVLAIIISCFTVFPTDTYAVGGQRMFDFDNASKGYVIVNYTHTDSETRLKVGITKSGQSAVYYYEIKSGKQAVLPLQMGSGQYTATLYINEFGSTYKVGQKQTAYVKIANATKVFLNSIQEIAWTKNGKVAALAKRLIKGKRTTKEKAMAIYSYIVRNFSYDYSKAGQVKTGKLTSYIPNPEVILKSKTGICYDIASLYAAMLRSAAIPAQLVKGTSKALGNAYHAWNNVYDSATGKWVTMDLTADMCREKGGASSWRTVKSTDYTAQQIY